MPGSPPAPPSHKLSFPDLDREIAALGDETIFQSARRNGLRIVGACGGRGTCGTCVVRVTERQIDHIHSGKLDLLEIHPAANAGDNPSRSRKKWLRACQLRVRSDCTVEVAPRSRAPVVRADAATGDINEVLPLDAAVCSRDLTLPIATLSDNICDADRITRAMGTTTPTIDLGAALRLVREHGLTLDDIIIDVSISALIADTAGLNREALAAIGLIGSDPELKGLHISGGLSNIAQQLPLKAADGSDLKLQLECAFLTLACPLGLDTVLATPWRAFQMLPDDNYVLGIFKQVLQASGIDVLRQVRKLYRK